MPRKTKAQKEKVKEAADVATSKSTDETPAQSEPTAVATATVEKTGIGEAQAESSAKRLCKDGCGKVAPSFGDYHQECYARYQTERGRVECVNYEQRCHNFTKPFFKDGQAQPTFCLECREAHQANVAESTAQTRSFAYSITEMLEGKYPQIDFAAATDLRDDGDVKFAIDATKEAAALYQASLNKANSLVAMHLATIQIPEKVLAVMAVIDQHLKRKGGDLVFKDLINDTERVGDQWDIAWCLNFVPSKDASLDMQERIKTLDELFAKATARAERFARPDPRRHEQLRKQRRDGQEQQRAVQFERIHRFNRRGDED